MKTAAKPKFKRYKNCINVLCNTGSYQSYIVLLQANCTKKDTYKAAAILTEALNNLKKEKKNGQ